MKKLKLDELGRPGLEVYKETQKLPLRIVLDNIRSLLNVGSIFRSCDAFLVEKIYLCGITGRPPHREIQKTALGATESVAWEYHHSAEELVKSLQEQGFTILAVEQTSSAVPLSAFKPEKDKHYVLILGNEVEGVNEKLLPYCDAALEIPQSGTKHSLNVSVAAGIALYKFYEALLTKN